MATNDKDKKPYKKPTVTQVKLEIGEAVLAACKWPGDITLKRTKGCVFIACSGSEAPS